MQPPKVLKWVKVIQVLLDLPVMLVPKVLKGVKVIKVIKDQRAMLH